MIKRREELLSRPVYSRTIAYDHPTQTARDHFPEFLCEMADKVRNAPNLAPLKGKEDQCVKPTLWK